MHNAIIVKRENKSLLQNEVWTSKRLKNSPSSYYHLSLFLQASLMALSLHHLYSPTLTSDDLTPLRDGVSLPQLLFQALTPPSNLQPWFKPPVCWNGCLLGSAHQGLFFVISAVESCHPFRHCLSSAPAITPSQPSMFVIMENPFGVTHVFATSPTCPPTS